MNRAQAVLRDLMQLLSEMESCGLCAFETSDVKRGSGVHETHSVRWRQLKRRAREALAEQPRPN
jgi:hypothetical protein